MRDRLMAERERKIENLSFITPICTHHVKLFFDFELWSNWWSSFHACFFLMLSAGNHTLYTLSVVRKCAFGATMPIEASPLKLEKFKFSEPKLA
jgi:hypothetical protein